MSVTYVVIRSRRARYVRLRVRPGAEVEIVVPTRVTISSPADVLRRHAKWLARHLHQEPAIADRDVTDGTLIKYAGGSVRVALTTSPRLTAERRAQVLHLGVPVGVEVATALDAWYRHEARFVISTEAQAAASAMNVTFSRIIIRDQRTRWGSCSTTGTLSFNWRLLLAAPETMRYVVVHEVAHLRHHHHGPQFWELVATHCPAYAQHRRWLREYGNSLQHVVAEDSIAPGAA